MLDKLKPVPKLPCFIVAKSMIQLSSHRSFCFWYLIHYRRHVQIYRVQIWIWTVSRFLLAFILLTSHKSCQNEAEAEQAERQTDGQLGCWGHRTFAAVSWTGGTKLFLLTDTITTHWMWQWEDVDASWSRGKKCYCDDPKWSSPQRTMTTCVSAYLQSKNKTCCRTK